MDDQPPQDIVPSLRSVAMPRDANPNGDIFGGWLMSQMDIAGGVHASLAANARVVTVAVEAMNFLLPVYVGDVLSCYCETTRIGTTSIGVHVQSWVQRRSDGRSEKVTQGLFTFVAIGENRRPTPITSPPPRSP
jgi:acyl-CoA thioesterase YciA